MLSKQYCNGYILLGFNYLIFDLHFLTTDIMVYKYLLYYIYRFSSYIRHSCWLNTTDGVIWAFAGPVILVIAVSIGFQK